MLTAEQKTLDLAIWALINKGLELAENALRDRSGRHDGDIEAEGHFNRAALTVAELGVSAETADKVIKYYLGRYKNPMFGFDEVHRAVSWSRFVKSRETLGAVLLIVVKDLGWIRVAESLAGYLGRRLTKAEVFMIVKEYTSNLGIKSDDTEKRLKELAAEYLSKSDQQRVEELIAEKTRRWEKYAD